MIFLIHIKEQQVKTTVLPMPAQTEREKAEKFMIKLETVHHVQQIKQLRLTVKNHHVLYQVEAVHGQIVQEL